MIFSRDKAEITKVLSRYRQNGDTIVFTNGCFDILHPGHIFILESAKSFGDILIVGLNSDASVRQLKGESRPIFTEPDRLKMLNGLSMVDEVIIFGEDTPIDLIKMVQPDVHVKGGDYRQEELPETPIVESLGGRVEIVPFIEGQSTSAIIEKLK